MWKDLIAYLADLAVFDELDEVLVVDPRVGEEVCHPQQPGLFSDQQTIMSKTSTYNRLHSFRVQSNCHPMPSITDTYGIVST
jgi:hypothetical protein